MERRRNGEAAPPGALLEGSHSAEPTTVEARRAERSASAGSLQDAPAPASGSLQGAPAPASAARGCARRLARLLRRPKGAGPGAKFWTHIDDVRTLEGHRTTLDSPGMALLVAAAVTHAPPHAAPACATHPTQASLWQVWL